MARHLHRRPRRPTSPSTTLYAARPSNGTFHARIATQVATVTAVIYLTGWGPVLWGAYAFVALADIATGGSSVWRPVALWSFLGMVVGEFCILQGWLPSRLSFAQATALSIMGGFVLFFVIRMAGATMEQKEESDAAVRRSEDRFRSLIQNSSDVTIIIDRQGIYQYLSPAV